MPAARKRHFDSLAAAILATALAAAGCASSPAGPPREKGTFRPADLVEIARLDPAIKLDIRYATPNNFTGRPVYPQARAFLQRPAAEALVRVNRALAEKGYGLLVFDGYRPWSITKLFWDITPPEKRSFVANPATGSKHNRGAAVDLSLYEVATGKEVEMPSAYDEFSERAAPDYAGGTQEQRARRDLLRAAMEKEGFTVDPGEWWHYNYRGWESWPILDVPFETISPSEGPEPGAGNRGRSMWERCVSPVIPSEARNLGARAARSLGPAGLGMTGLAKKPHQQPRS
jgi:D-alanyl-D-alanine dipeptidase